MSFLLRNIARYAAQKLASNPRARETAAKAARVVVGEARQIARSEDKARAAGQARCGLDLALDVAQVADREGTGRQRKRDSRERTGRSI